MIDFSRSISASETSACDLARVDPSFLNRLAWRERWASRQDSEERARTALSVARAANLPHSSSERGLAKRTLAWLAKWRGDFDEANRLCLKAEALLTEREHPAARADIYSTLAVVHYSRNRMDLAKNCVERGLHILEGEGPDDTLVDLLITRATVQRYCGLSARAAATLDRARSLARGRELARVGHNIARGLLAESENESALEEALQSIELARKHNNRVILPYALEIAGAALSAVGETDRAVAFFDEALAIAIEDDDARAQCQIIRYHAEAEHLRGNFERARDLYRHGAAICEDLSYWLWQKTFLLALADVNEALGDLTAALDNHRSAWQLENKRRV